MKKNTHEEIGFVFIHGAGLEGQIWSNVSEGLGQPSLLLDYPLRKGPVDSRSDLALEDYVSHMEKQVNQWGIERFVTRRTFARGRSSPEARFQIL